MDHDLLAMKPVAPPVIGPLYTTQEVAKLLRVSQRTVQEWVRAGELTAVRYGRLLRIRQADLATFGEVLPRRTPAPGNAERDEGGEAVDATRAAQ